MFRVISFQIHLYSTCSFFRGSFFFLRRRAFRARMRRIHIIQMQRNINSWQRLLAAYYVASRTKRKNEIMDSFFFLSFALCMPLPHHIYTRKYTGQKQNERKNQNFCKDETNDASSRINCLLLVNERRTKESTK